MSTSMPQALCELGVSEETLTGKERERLHADGYAILGQLLSHNQAADQRAQLDALVAGEGEDAGKDFFQEAGCVTLGSLLNKVSGLDMCVLHPRVLAAAAHLMGEDFGLSSLSARTPLPGQGEQELHRDSSDRSVNALWMISEFTEGNGATRVVPGSHRLGGKTPEEMGVDPLVPHPDEVRLTGPAGTLVVMDTWTWHGGTVNRTPHPRYLVSALFMPRGRYQARADRRLLPGTRARLSRAALHVLDHEPIGILRDRLSAPG